MVPQVHPAGLQAQERDGRQASSTGAQQEELGGQGERLCAVLVYWEYVGVGE